MTPEQVNAEAARLLARPQDWTQGEFARDWQGAPVDPCSPEAVCRCINGAYRAVLGIPVGQKSADADRAADEFCDANDIEHVSGRGKWAIVFWQDHPDLQHSLVIAALKRAAGA